MTVETLSMVVGTRAAARLEALKSRLGDTPDERAAEHIDSPALRVRVMSVVQMPDAGLDIVVMSCGHKTVIEHDEPNGSLVGAETTCDRSHRAA